MPASARRTPAIGSGAPAHNLALAWNGGRWRGRPTRSRGVLAINPPRNPIYRYPLTCRPGLNSHCPFGGDSGQHVVPALSMLALMTGFPAHPCPPVAGHTPTPASSSNAMSAPIFSASLCILGNCRQGIAEFPLRPLPRPGIQVSGRSTPSPSSDASRRVAHRHPKLVRNRVAKSGMSISGCRSRSRPGCCPVPPASSSRRSLW